MPQRTISPASNRPARRHERRDGHDIADIYEARLLANGLRSDDFVMLRSSTDLPRLPDITPIRFGRGAEHQILFPIAEIPDKTPSQELDDATADAAGTLPEQD